MLAYTYIESILLSAHSAWLRFWTCLAILAKDFFQSSQQVHHIYMGLMETSLMRQLGKLVGYRRGCLSNPVAAVVSG